MKNFTKNSALRSLRWLYCLLLLASLGIGRAQAQTTVQVGTGTSTTPYFPLYTCYGYNWSQTIYLTSEINGGGWTGPGYIYKIRYFYASSAALGLWKDWVIYMANTTQSTFATTTSWIPGGSMSTVLSADITSSIPGVGNWMELTLSTPFLWDGVSNLVVGVDENTPGYNCTAYWRYTAVGASSNYRSMLYYSDVTNPNPLSPPSANLRYNYVPNTQFVFGPATPCSGVPTGGTASVTPANPCAGADITLSVSGSTLAPGITYQWQSGSSSTGPWTNIAGATGTSYMTTATGCNWYRIQVTCNNTPGGVAYSSAVQVCPTPTPYASIPFVESFEDWQNGCNVKDIPGSSWINKPATGDASWRRNDEGATANWYSPTTGPYSPASVVGNYSARFHSYYSGANTPGQLDLYVNCATVTGNKELSFYYITPSGNPYPGASVKVSYSTNGGSTFTQLANLGPNSSWTYQSFVLPSNSATTVIRFEAAVQYQYYTPDIGLDYVRVLPPCSGKPNAGVIAPVNPCPNSNFTLNLSGNTQSAGLTYQWQESTNGTTWSNSPGGTQMFLSTTAGTTPKWYRAIVTCSNATAPNNSDTTPAYLANLADFYYCYCQAGSNPIYGYTANIGNVKLQRQPSNQIILDNGVGTPVLSNLTATQNYTNFTNLPATPLYRDSTYKATVTNINYYTYGYSTNYAGIYIDFDRNGTFDPGERVLYQNVNYHTTNPSQQVSQNFTVPAQAGIGLTGMRVIVFPYYNTINPCGTQYYGEVEDYLVNVDYPPCDGPTNAGIAEISDTSMCPGYTLYLTDTTHEKFRSGLSWVWEKSVNGGSTWTTLPNSTNKDTASDVMTGASQYRLRMMCTISNSTTFSNIVSVNVKPPYMCYCYSQAIGGNKDTSDIGSFSIGNFVVTTGGPHLLNPTAKRSRTSYTHLTPIELYADSTYEVDVFHTMWNNNHGNARVTMFMDFNNNLQYDIPAERIDLMSANPTNWISTANGWYLVNSITIPTAVIPNVPTGMRLIINNNLNPNNPSDQGCGTYTSGETEDYVVIFRKEWPVGVGEIANLQDLNVFPNPTTGKFAVQFQASSPVEDLQITVTNVTGQQIIKQQHSKVSNQFSTELDLTEQAKGIYFVEIRADGQHMVRKLVVR